MYNAGVGAAFRGKIINRLLMKNSLPRDLESGLLPSALFERFAGNMRRFHPRGNDVEHGKQPKEQQPALPHFV
jgi:hypothetical protein